MDLSDCSLNQTPENNYQPKEPYTIIVSENPYSYSVQGIAKDGKWYLWEQYILSDISLPESENPWAWIFKWRNQ